MEPDPNAQGQNGSEGQSNQSDNTQSDPNEQRFAGFQKRLDEVTAKTHEYRRENEDLRGIITQQQSTLAQYQTRQATPQEQAPEIDPEDEVKFGHLLKKHLAPFQQQIAQLTGAFVQSRNGSAMAEAESKLKAIGNPAITEEYNKLINIWQRNGTLANGTYVPDDALKVAVGNVALSTLLKGAENNQQRQEFNANGFVPMQGTGGRSNGGQRSNASQSVEKDITEMSEGELQKFLEDQTKKNPNGFGL